MARSTLSVEVFAAKDPSGAVRDLLLCVPRRCGLKQADTLRVNGQQMQAMGRKSVLPFELPPLDAQSRQYLLTFAKLGQELSVAELSPLGLYDAYQLRLEVVS